jgi:hypothetical protein
VKHIAFVIWMIGFPLSTTINSKPISSYENGYDVAVFIFIIWIAVGYWITKIK